jgi:hypothetical protein
MAPHQATFDLHRARTANHSTPSTTTNRNPARAHDTDLDKWQGHNFHSEVPDPGTTITICFHNVHGIRRKGTTLSQGIHDIVATYQPYNIQILNMSEHHLPLADPGFRQFFHETATKINQGRIVHQMNSSPESSMKSGKLMGGTGIIALNESIGRLEPKGKGGDPLGRWSYIHLRRIRLPPLTIISIYQVCTHPTNQIGHTAWHQQRRALDLAHRDEHPRTAFITDISKLLHHLQASNHDIIMGGDWNETIHDSHSGLAKLCLEHDLLDPWLTTYPSHRDFATFEFGNRRIDATLVSRRLLPYITHIGYSPVGLMSNSDHRALMVSFNTKLLFGQTLDQLPAITTRGVRSKDKMSITTFIETMHQHLLANNAFSRGQRLLLSDSQNHDLAEALDRLIGEAGDSGEKKCRRRRTPWFSNTLVRDRLELSHLKHYRNGLRCNRDRSIVTHFNLNAIDRDQPLPSEQDLMEVLFQGKARKFAETKAKSEAIRQNELRDKITELEDSNMPKTQASIIRKISRQESGTAAWRALAFTLNENNIHQKLDRLDIPEDWPAAHTETSAETILADPKMTTEWRTITNPLDIEYFLLLRNRTHFGQAQGTPFTISPLKELIDWTASSEASEEILSGQYVAPAEMSDLCQQVLQECKSSATQNSLPAHLELNAFSGKISSWREKTTTSPSGRHLGRYKALFTSGRYHESEHPKEFKLFESKQKEIAQLILSITNYCINHGHVLDRWKLIVNTMKEYTTSIGYESSISTRRTSTSYWL